MINMDNNSNYIVKNKKVKFSQCITLKHIRGVQVHNLGIRWSRVVNFTPHSQSGQFQRNKNVLILLEFKPRTTQPVARCYTDYTILAPS